MKAIVWLGMLLLLSGLQEGREKGVIVVRIHGLRHDRGQVRVALFASEDGFPGKLEKAHRKQYTPILDRRATAVFTEIPYGEYAIGVFHDENGNRKMDRNFLGIPTEPYGASNDARRIFGPPRYSDARFLVVQDTLTLDIKVH